MYCHTLDRFRGAWLGSMTGFLILPKAIPLRKEPHLKRLSEQYPKEQPYRHRTKIKLESFILREQLAEITIESPRRDADAIAELLVKKIESKQQSNSLAQYSYCLLLLLPLIIFYNDNWNLLQKIVRNCCLKLSNLSHISELEIDTLLWSYLVILILNNRLELNGRDFAQLAKQTLANVAAKKTTLTTQLEMVIAAIERGTSLQQLSNELLSEGNSAQSAIALSYYCFATTASDFKLSVQRATNLESEIAGLTAVLTGTLSGAYNGMAGIPFNWKKMANQDTAYSLASQTVLKLFRAWLGIYRAENEPESNLEIQAIALQGLIQTRKSLKIISQQSFS